MAESCFSKWRLIFRVGYFFFVYGYGYVSKRADGDTQCPIRSRLITTLFLMTNASYAVRLIRRLFFFFRKLLACFYLTAFAICRTEQRPLHLLPERMGGGYHSAGNDVLDPITSVKASRHTAKMRRSHDPLNLPSHNEIILPPHWIFSPPRNQCDLVLDYPVR